MKKQNFLIGSSIYIGFSILVFFVLSGSIDTLSFSLMSLTLAAILFLMGEFSHRKIKQKTNHVDMQGENSGIICDGDMDD
ncbi:MAG: hypothetical protein J7K65_09820 [Planctomycetes bacterium]|nr:hypothetical protein [Planctomycetota bacterium]